MQATQEEASIPEVAKQSLKACIEICRDNGAQVVLLSIPSPNDWSMKRHNAAARLSDELGVELLDLNLCMEEIGLDWSKYTCDEGHHMNYRGAEKISRYLGNYLAETGLLRDRRDDKDYRQWNADCAAYAEARDEKIK